MRKNHKPDIDSEQSEDLKDDELMAMNRHFKNRRSNRNSKMAPEMESLYKDALMNVIFGQFQAASKKLKNLISLYPDNPDAFHLLGTMHEELGEFDKAVEYFFMHTYLSPPNLEKWVKVADMSFNLKMYTQAAYCYGRALKIETFNIDLLIKRAESFQLSYQSKKAISTYKKILSITQSLAVLKKYAKLRFKRCEYQTAREILFSYPKHQQDPHVAYMISQTYLKQQKFLDLLDYASGYIKNQQTKQAEFDIQNLPIQFAKLIYVCLIRLERKQFQILNFSVDNIKRVLIQGYEQSYAQVYQEVIPYLKSTPTQCYQFLKFLIKFKAHQTLDNYLLYSEYLKSQKNYEQAIKILNEGLKIHENSTEIKSQLNHIKVVSGKWKDIKRSETLDFKKTTLKNFSKNQDIFYSDSQDELQMDIQEADFVQPSEFFNKIKNQINDGQQSRKKSLTTTNQKRQIQTEDPQIIKKLLLNCKQTIKSIIDYNLQSKLIISKSFKRVEQCVQFLISITSNSKCQQKQQKEGLFNRRNRRRRYFTSKQSFRQQSINQNLQVILQIVNSVVQFMKALLKTNQCLRVKHLAQILSKAYFFRWQNKSNQLKIVKETIYEIGLLACLNLQKYQTAVFFIRYLAHKQPENSFYLLVVNYLLHNSSTKISMNSLLGNYSSKLSTNLIIEQQKKSLQQKDSIFDDEDIMSDNLSYPRKMSNVSNLSDILKDNLKLNYLFGIEYMETGFFQLAISSFLKIINLCQGQIRKNIWLSLCSCFLQISSSRTCHSKLQYTNRSSYCLLQYINCSNDSLEISFNRARWYSQVRLNDNAITQFNKILSSGYKNQSEKAVHEKCAYCLICIYKSMENWDMVNSISQNYFHVKQ